MTSSDALAAASRRTLVRLVGRGDLVRPLPGLVADVAAWADEDVRCRAALMCANAEGALSHLTALARWGLREPSGGPVHVTVPERRHLRGTPDVRYHRRRDFRVGAPATVTRDGLRVVRLERAVVESWPMLTDEARRAAAIAAVAERRTTPARLRAELTSLSNLADLAQLMALLDRLESGCRSHLELWGCEHVFAHPSLPRPRRLSRSAVALSTSTCSTTRNEWTSSSTVPPTTPATPSASGTYGAMRR